MGDDLQLIHYVLSGAGVVIMFLLGAVWSVLDSRIKDNAKDINAQGAEFNRFQLKVAEEYVSYERLTEALKPLHDEQTKMNNALERFFGLLASKADKP